MIARRVLIFVKTKSITTFWYITLVYTLITELDRAFRNRVIHFIIKMLNFWIHEPLTVKQFQNYLFAFSYPA